MKGLLANWLWLFVFGALAAGFIIGGWSASNESPSRHQIQRANSVESSSLPAINQSHADERSADAKEKENRTFWSWVGNFFELKLTDVIIAIFTIVLAIKTWGLFMETAGLRSAADKQSLDMQASIAAANRSAPAAERALTDLERPWIFVFGVTRPLRDIDGEFFVDYTVANYGKMPAIIEFPRIGFVFEDARGDPQQPPLVEDDHSLMTSEILRAGEERRLREYFPTNPNGGARFRIINEGTPQEALMQIPDVDLGGGHIMFFRAVISYRGPVSQRHETGANWLYRDPWDFGTSLDEYTY